MEMCEKIAPNADTATTSRNASVQRRCSASALAQRFEPSFSVIVRPVLRSRGRGCCGHVGRRRAPRGAMRLARAGGDARDGARWGRAPDGPFHEPWGRAGARNRSYHRRGARPRPNTAAGRLFLRVASSVVRLRHDATLNPSDPPLGIGYSFPHPARVRARAAPDAGPGAAADLCWACCAAAAAGGSGRSAPSAQLMPKSSSKCVGFGARDRL